MPITWGLSASPIEQPHDYAQHISWELGDIASVSKPFEIELRSGKKSAKSDHLKTWGPRDNDEGKLVKSVPAVIDAAYPPPFQLEYLP